MPSDDQNTLEQPISVPLMRTVMPIAPGRPHPELATYEEAEIVSNDLMNSGAVEVQIYCSEADADAGMPAPNGSHRAFLLTWMDRNTLTGVQVAFNCSAAGLYRELLAIPNGVWVHDYDARTMRRKAV